MEEIKMLQPILSIVLTVLGLIMVVFGWFIVKVFSAVTESLNKLESRINDLSGIISGLNATQLAYKENTEDIKIKCVSRHAEINKTLKEHDCKLNEHDTSIQLLKQKVQL